MTIALNQNVCFNFNLQVLKQALSLAQIVVEEVNQEEQEEEAEYIEYKRINSLKYTFRTNKFSMVFCY